ncbi:DoxX-like family protein [Paenibacillus sp. MMO-177]|uniref:DoxX-like family protein n=1 Tax=Paenibacillus sp. MMO-177 TaxID=3081289 RepID=UPI00301856F7
MKRRPIYVELNIHADMEKLWTYTQTAELHEQWDLRFSSITYLPRNAERNTQAFLYETRIGFEGTGARLSTLAFGSEQKISLIRHGAGYWQYRQNADSITFLTRYDYATRFGRLGQWFDSLLFRPLFGWATALSFDVLRLWLEKQIPPAVSLQRTLIHYLCTGLLSLLWLYEGLIPKWIYPEAGELSMMQSTHMFPGMELQALKWLGAAEILLGLMLLPYHRAKWIYQLQSAGLLALAGGALACTPSLLTQPFNPFVISAAMLGLCLTGMWTSRDLPNAVNCIRKKGEGKK